MDRQDLLRILQFIENSLKGNWSAHEGFQYLQERMLMLRMILEKSGDNLAENPEKYKILVVQIATLELLVQKYLVRISKQSTTLQTRTGI